LRFFFDFSRKDCSLRDYQGDEFQTFESAREYADAIVCQMENSLSGKWIGWRVDVHNADGMKFFSIPVETVPEVAKLTVIAPGTARARTCAAGR
jgi:hypothetical protein